jgi:hypothetical protein
VEFGTGDVEFSSRALESFRREMKLALKKTELERREVDLYQDRSGVLA